MRFKKNEARQILQEELKKVDWPTASQFSVGKKRIEAGHLDWWLENLKDSEKPDTDRSLAYLRAYQKIAKGNNLNAGGLHLDRDRLRMDRSIIKRLYKEGYLQWHDNPTGIKEPTFQITEKGLDWIAT